MAPRVNVWSDRHPVSISHRLIRRVRLYLERHRPDLFFSRLAKCAEAAISRGSASEDRVVSFSAKLPFSEIDFGALLDADARTALKQVADLALAHQFDLLGSGRVHLGDKIRWHEDFVTGFTWDPTQIYSKVRAQTPSGSDIKRPWELSRCHHFVALGLAWRVFGEDAYCQEYVAQVEDWLSSNPVGYGVNWACPMDVAIRAVNWIAGFALMRPALSVDGFETFRSALLRSLWAHAAFIASHLEWNGPCSERRANHFLSNVVGLYTLGLLFTNTSRGQRWQALGKRWLEIEIRRQVLEDGVHFECCTSYHRLCMEMFIWCYALGQQHGDTYSAGYRARLAKMQIFAAGYSRRGAGAPVIGDNDDGRLLYSGLADINDHEYLWASEPSGRSTVERALLWGDSRMQASQAHGLAAFDSGGFYVLRHAHVHLLVRAGRLAHLGTHAHCDQLSFELSLKQRPVFVDRGTYVYTSDEGQRAVYRGTQAHNVFSINGQEQDRAYHTFFGLVNDTRTRVHHRNAHEIKASIRGFHALERPDLRCTRVFQLDLPAKSIRISDTISAIRPGDTLEWFFHLAPGLSAEPADNKVRIVGEVGFICSLSFPEALVFEAKPFEHSPSYGVKRDAQSFVLSTKAIEPCDSYALHFSIAWD